MSAACCWLCWSACCSSYAAWFCASYFDCWWCDTAPAVPATTAVVAATRSNPPLLRLIMERLLWLNVQLAFGHSIDNSGRDQFMHQYFAVRILDCRRKGARPCILKEQQRRRGIRFKHFADLGDVIFSEQARYLRNDGIDLTGNLFAKIIDLERKHRSVYIFGNEHDV